MDTNDPASNDREQALAALLVDSVRLRQARGVVTTLRDLHSLLDVTQPLALQVAYRLKMDSVVTIDTDEIDAFASVISLPQRAPDRSNDDG